MFDSSSSTNPLYEQGFANRNTAQPITSPLPPEYVRLKNVELPPFLPNYGWDEQSKNLLIEAARLRGGGLLIPALAEWFDQRIRPAVVPFYQYEKQRLGAHAARTPLAEAMLKAGMELPDDGLENLDYNTFVDELDNRLDERREDLHGRSRLGKGMVYAIGTLKTGLSLPFVATMVEGLGLSWGPFTLILALLLSVALGFVPTLLWSTWYGIFEQVFGKNEAPRRIMPAGDTIYEGFTDHYEPAYEVSVTGKAVLLSLVTAVLGVAGYAWVVVDSHTFERLQKGLGLPMALTLTIGLFGAALAIAIQKHHFGRLENELTRQRQGVLERVRGDLLTVYGNQVPLERADAIVSAMGWAVNRVTNLTQWILTHDLNNEANREMLQRLLVTQTMPIPIGDNATSSSRRRW